MKHNEIHILYFEFLTQVKETVNQKIVAFGKKFIPKSILPTVQWYYNRHYQIHNFDKEKIQIIVSDYSDTSDKEIREIVNHVSKNGLSAFPYTWADMRTSENRKKMKAIRVFRDETYKLPYVYLDNKKLYFPADWEEERIRGYYFGLQELEQHPLSPHCYLSDDFTVDNESIVVDCGVAEGNFGLSIVEICKMLYLFEPDDEWMKPLEATFAPWKEKVVVVQKYLSDKTDDMNITLDDFFTDKEYPNFMKLDVEGYEERLLLGADKILSSEDMKKVVTCVYHKAEDEEVLRKILRDHKFSTIYTKGYTTLSIDNKPPYLRRGVIRATKTQ